MFVGEDFVELIEAGGVNDTKFDLVAMSIGKEDSSDLKGVVVTDAGIIDGKPLDDVVGCVGLMEH
jgi:hypothetical protein